MKRRRLRATKLRCMGDKTIGYSLAVTPSESEHLEALLPESIFQPAPEKRAGLSSRCGSG